MTTTGTDVSPPSADFMGGGGELGARMRALDWSATSLGPVESWPQSLRTAVGICLGSRFPILIWWGRNMVMLYNDAYRPMLGSTKHPRALGAPGRLIWPEIWDIIGPMLEGVLSRGAATFSEDQLLLLHRNGYLEECYFTFSYSPIGDEAGAVGGIFTAVTETTGRVLSERRLRTLRLLSEATAGARSPEEACRMAGKTLSRNRADLPFALVYLIEDEGRAARLQGWAGIAPGTPASPVLLDLSANSPWRAEEVAVLGQPLLVKGLVRRLGPLPAGPWADPPDAALIQPFGSGQAAPTGFVICGLSPRRALDDDYRGFLRLAAGHIGTAVSNARAYEEERRRALALAELDQAKSIFFSNVSHEFRTPLTLLLAPLEDALLDPDHPLDDAHRQRLQVAQRNSLRLLKLVNSLLDFSRIEAGRVQANVEPTDLAALTEDLASAFRSAIERAGLRLEVRCPPLPRVVYVDRDMWEKVVLNLVSNALKFTLAGEIEVVVSPSADGTAAELTVRDSGTGIPAGELPHLFERFHRVAGARGRSHEGTGIGLALVQELVKLHGGTVGVTSEPDRGSSFTVRVPFGTEHLPGSRSDPSEGLSSTATGAEAYVEEALRWVAPAEAVPHLGGTLTPAGLTRARVLFADDNADMRDYVQRLLEPQYDVVTMRNGADALALLRSDRFELVLADVMMPVMDGFALLQALRADPATEGLPVILLSARAGEEARVEGLSRGADDYLVKPFAARELLARVGATLHLARLRAEADAQVRQSERRYRSLAEATAQVIWTADPAGRFSEPSATWEEYTGQPWQAYRGTGYFGAIHPEDQERCRQLWQAALDRGDPVEARFRLRRRDGAWRQVLARGVPVRGVDGSLREWVGTVTDVEEQRLAEERLRQAAKMEAVGRLAGGLAHDFNNQLQAVSGFVNFVDKDPALGAAARHDLHEIRKAAERMASLTRQLLAFSRQQILRPETLDLNAAVADSQSLLQRLIGTDVEMVVQMGHGPKWVQVDRAQLLQVLMNLAINARDAMPGGGELMIRTEARDLAPDDTLRLPVSGVTPGPWARLTVSDTGAGIAPEHLPHIFEPFFTTKGVGEGTGLGLATVHGVIAQSRGHIWVESPSSQGTTFTVLLPLVKEPVEPGRSAGDGAARAARAAQVLVVDDEEVVQRIVGRILEGAGYTVRSARGGDEALAILADAAGPVDLMVSDVVMPGMGGVVLRERVAAGFPGLPVIWISGYPRDTAFPGAAMPPEQAFLEKPVSAEILLATARQLIGRSGSHGGG